MVCSNLADETGSIEAQGSSRSSTSGWTATARAMPLTRTSLSPAGLGGAAAPSRIDVLDVHRSKRATWRKPHDLAVCVETNQFLDCGQEAGDRPR